MNPFSAPIILNPQRSNYLLVVLSIFTLSLILSVLIFSLGIFFKMGLILITLIWFYHVLRKHALRTHPDILRVELRPDQRWIVYLVPEVPLDAELLDECLVQPWLTVLVFKLPDRRKRSVMLLADNVDQDAFRRCRVRLLHAI